MRVALQTASVTEKALASKNLEMKELKAELTNAKDGQARAEDLASKITSLEVEIMTVRERRSASHI